MGKFKGNQKGFGAIESVLILVIVCLIGSVGWYVYKAMKSTNSAYGLASSTSNSASPKFSKITKKPAVPAVTMEQYVNTEYGFSFDYPSSWTQTATLSDIGRGHAEGDVVVTSPNGTKVHFGPNLGGKGGDCIDPDTNTRTTKNCSTRNIISVDKLPTSSVSKPVYFYDIGLTSPDSNGAKTVYYVDIMSGDAAPTEVGKSVGAYLYPYDEITDTKVGYVTVYVEGKDDTTNGSKTFFNSNEVKEASPILKSFKLLD